MRIKSSVTVKKRHKKVLKQAAGFARGRRHSYRRAKETTLKAGAFAYVGRKQKKRNFRRLWITRISAAAREQGMNYSLFVRNLKLHHIILDRKILSDLAIADPATFKKIIDITQTKEEKEKKTN